MQLFGTVNRDAGCDVRSSEVVGTGESGLQDRAKMGLVGKMRVGGITMTDDEMRCPICNELLNYDEVDIGVGIQTGNYRCDRCGWCPDRDDEEYCSQATGMEV